MRPSVSQFQHFLRVALVALPLLLLLGLNGRTVSLLRPAGPAPTPSSRVYAQPRATVVKQKVLLEAASPLGAYLAPAAALGWLPAVLPVAAWPAHRLRQAAAVIPVASELLFVAQRCHQQVLRGAVSPQAP